MQRRNFLHAAAFAAAAFGVPLARAEQAFSMDAPAMPSENLFASDPERYWTELRRQWLLAPDRINLNCGAIGCAPLPVLRATIEHMLAAEEFRDAMAAFLHISRDELAILRNATEANNVVCNGLDLKSGDEAILTDQEHPGCRGCWEQKAARFGINIVNVALPTPPQSPEEVVALF